MKKPIVIHKKSRKNHIREVTKMVEVQKCPTRYAEIIPEPTARKKPFIRSNEYLQSWRMW